MPFMPYVVRNPKSEAKINQPNRQGFTIDKHDVVRFDVSMCNINTAEEVQSSKQLKTKEKVKFFMGWRVGTTK